MEIIAYADGYGIGVKRYRLQDGEGLHNLLFLLEPAGELRGNVVDEFSNPVAGAEIEVVYSRPLSRLTTLDLGTSDIRPAEDGTFRVRNLQPEVPFTVIARDPATGRTNEAGAASDMLFADQRREGVVIVLQDRQ